MAGRVVFRACLAGGIGISLSGWLLAVNSWFIYASVIAAAALVSLALNERGRTRAALVLMLLTMTICAFAACLLYEGLNDVAACVFPVIVVLAGLTLDRRLLVAFTVFIGLGAAAVSWVRWSILRSDTFSSPQMADLVMVILTCSLTALITGRLAEYARKSLRRVGESEERFRSLFENATLGIYRTTPAGRIDVANPTLVRMLGYESSSDLASLNLEEKIAPASALGAFRKVLDREGVIRGLESAWIRRDGRPLHVRESARALKDESGAVLSYEGIVEDITERKRAEEELRENEQRLNSIYNTVADVIFQLAVEPEGQFRFVSVNPAFLRVTGLRLETVVGKTVNEVIPEPSRASVLGKYRQAVAEKSIVHWEETSDYPAGRLTGEVSVAPIFDNKGRCTHLVGSVHDITERKRAAEQAHTLELQLAHAQKMESIGRLGGGIAHDFSNLMNVIQLHVDSALEELSEEDPLTEPLAEIRNASAKAVALARQLMAFSRKQVLETEVLNVNSLVEECAKLIRPLIGEDVQLVFSPAAELVLVKADAGQLSQVLMNLAVNSRDAMPDGGTLTIETAAVEMNGSDARFHSEAQPGPYVMLAVRDTGIGMDSETQARAFEPFFTTKEVGKGTGLGLSMVYGIVKQSGGFVTVQSQQGRGTEFRVYLPQVFESAEPVVLADVQADGRGVETILVVEDEPALRTPVCKLLEDAGYRVLVGKDGDHAIQISNQHTGPLHLLLTDVVMPHMSGPELAERLLAVYPEMRVLYMSGYPQTRRPDHVLISDVDLIQKPFTKHKLLRRLREVLESSAAAS